MMLPPPASRGPSRALSGLAHLLVSVVSFAAGFILCDALDPSSTGAIVTSSLISGAFGVILGACLLGGFGLILWRQMSLGAENAVWAYMSRRDRRKSRSSGSRSGSFGADQSWMPSDFSQMSQSVTGISQPPGPPIIPERLGGGVPMHTFAGHINRPRARSLSEQVAEQEDQTIPSVPRTQEPISLGPETSALLREDTEYEEIDYQMLGKVGDTEIQPSQADSTAIRPARLGRMPPVPEAASIPRAPGNPYRGRVPARRDRLKGDELE